MRHNSRLVIKDLIKSMLPLHIKYRLHINMKGKGDFISFSRIVERIKCLEANALIRAITQRILMQTFTWAILAPEARSNIRAYQQF